MKKRSALVLPLIFSISFFSAARAAEKASAGETNSPAPLPGGVTLQKDIEYVPGGGKSRTLDLYLPVSSGPMPLVIFIHGGGWRGGSKDGCPAKFLSGHGYAVASLNYRVSREAVFPAQIDDCRAAIKFLRAHAAEYMLDSAHVGVWGGSAGGHLAALLGTSAAVDFSTMPAKVMEPGKVDETIAVQCVVEMYGASDFTLLMADKGQVEHGVGKAAIQLMGSSADDPKLIEKSQWASPITYVRRDNPPFLLQHGDADRIMPLAQSRAMLAALQAAGVDATLTVMPGADHAGAPLFTAENFQSLAEFFDRHLKTGK